MGIVSPDGTHKSTVGICDAEGCNEQYPHHKWGAMKASREGWFFQKDGKIWCPKHTPAWVDSWRKRKQR